MANTNTTTVVPGNEITFEIDLHAVYGGPLVDADVIPTYQIFDPNSILLASGNSIHISTGIYQVLYTVLTTADISDYYRIVWNATINGNTDSNLWEYFRVVPATPQYLPVLISDDWLSQIKKVIAYPKLPKLHLSDDEIKQYAVFPALTQYFIKFPIKSTVQVFSTELSTMDFPDDYTFGLLDCRIVDIGTIGGTGSSFWDILAYQRMGVLGNTNVYGRRGYNPNALYQQRLQLQQAMKSQQNLLVTIKFNIDYPNRKVEIYTSTTGKINITWAKFSDNFDDIFYPRKFDVIELAQANLLDHVCDTFGIISDTTLDININVTELRARATDLRTKILDKWMQFPAVILLKNV